MEDDPIVCTFVSMDGKRELGYIHRSDIDTNGDCQIFCYEKKNKKTGKSKLKYTTNEKEYKDYLNKNGINV